MEHQQKHRAGENKLEERPNLMKRRNRQLLSGEKRRGEKRQGEEKEGETHDGRGLTAGTHVPGLRRGIGTPQPEAEEHHAPTAGVLSQILSTPEGDFR